MRFSHPDAMPFFSMISGVLVSGTVNNIARRILCKYLPLLFYYRFFDVCAL